MRSIVLNRAEEYNTIAAVQGWCIGGGTGLVLCADMIVAADSAVFGYPPSRVWGTPTTAMWVYRMGLEKAKRYLLTGDEIGAEEAARIGMILEVVPEADLTEHATALAKRMAMRIARHTQEGLDFVTRAQDVGFRQAVRERDDPFGDYGSRPRS